MSLLFNYSFNNITSAFLPGALANVAGSPSVGIGDGPQGINTLHTDGKLSWGWLPNISVPINSYGLIIGAGFNVTSFGMSQVGLIAIGSGSPAPETSTLSLTVASDGSMSAVNSTGSGTAATSPSGTFTFGNRHEVEVTVSTFGTSARVTVYLDGVAVTGLNDIGLGSLNALNDGSTIHSVAVGGSGFGGTETTLLVDSMYACDTNGSAPCNAALGPCISVVMIPNAPGQFSDWTPNGASLGWECISEIPPDNDTTFISSAVSGTQEACELSPPVPTITAVYGVSVISDQRQTQAGGGRTIALGVGNGSSTAYGSLFGTWGLGTTYVMNTTPFGSNPLTSAPWVLSDLTTLQVLAKVDS